MATESTSRRRLRFSRRSFGAAAFLACLTAQVTFAATRFSAAEGLPVAEVSAIASDEAGHLWVGTHAGLRMLAGGRFVVEDAMIASSIASPVYREEIRDIATGQSGEVWVATAGTLHRRDADGRWEEGAGRAAGLEGNVASVLSTVGGDVWAGSENDGLFRQSAGTWESVDPALQVTALATDGNGSVWVAGSRDGAVLVREPGAEGELVLALGADGLPAGTAQALAGDADGVWLGTSTGLAFVPTNAETITSYDLSALQSTSVLSIAPAGGGSAWVGTASGLAFVRDGDVDLTEEHAPDLAGTSIASLALDHTGDLWVGTPTGLTKVPLRSWVPAGAPVHGRISSAGYTTNGDAYAVSDGGMYVAGADGWSVVAGLQGQPVREAAADRAGGILVGTDAGWGTVRDGAYTPDDRCCGGPVDALLQDDAGRIWVGTPEGLEVVDEAASIAYFRKSADDAGLGQDPVVDLFAGGPGVVWAATSNGGATPFHGLVAGKRVSGNTTAGGLSSDRVDAGLVATNGEMWLGTQAGLNHRVNGQWVTESGILGGPINTLVDAGSGRIWVGTESSGLVLVDCSIRFDDGCATSPFGEADGLGASSITALATNAGELLIGTSRGLTRHALDVTPPTVTFGRVEVVNTSTGDYLQLKAGGRLVDRQPCAPCEPTLPFDTGSVDLGIVGTDLEDPVGVRFLVGSEINPSQLVTTAEFGRAVEPDQVYITTVTALDRHFNRSAPATVTFAIAPTPLEQEPWFIAAVLVPGALALLLAVLWFQSRDRLRYRSALVLFRAVGDRIEAQLSDNGATPDWQPLGPGLARLGLLHDGLEADAALDPKLVASVGEQLYRSLSGTDDRLRALAGRRPVRLVLDMAGIGGLERLPWEVVHRGRTFDEVQPADPAPGPASVAPVRGDEPLTDGRLALVRRVQVREGVTVAGEQPGFTSRLRLRPGRLRVLVARPTPHDRTPVASDEYEAIERVAMTSRGRLEVVAMSLSQRDRLPSDLDQDLDVFHFIGHGEMWKGKPALLFEDADRGAHRATLSQLIEILGQVDGRTRRPRLVVLSACQSAQEAADQPASGIAAGLVAAGVVPAAIGMGYLFHMQSASGFSAALYASLLRFGQIEHAVAAARRSIRLAAVDKEDWLVPRLYARNPAGATFKLPGGR